MSWWRSALYVENWLLVGRSVDYLAQDAAPSALQHYWSLSVEEQFYIIWPLLMLGTGWLARRSGLGVRGVFLSALSVVTLASLGYGIYVSYVDPAPGYFLTTTRVWELGIGGLLALTASRYVPGRGLGGVLGWGGMVAIGVSAWFYSNRLPFPGYEALLPTLGAGALLFARVGGESVLGRCLGTRPMQYVGDISYSLYLWHWPVVVFYGPATGREVSTLQDGMLVVVVSFVLAHASKVLLEERYRHGRPGETFRPFGILAALLALVLCAAAPLWWGGQRHLSGLVGGEGGGAAITGLPADPMSARLDLAPAYAENCIAPSRGGDVRVCRYGAEAGPVVMAIGDSHMVQWLPALSRVADAEGWQLVALTKTGCAFMSFTADEVDTVERKSCAEWNRGVVERVAAEAPRLVIVTNSIGAIHMLGRDGDPAARVSSRMADAWDRIRESRRFPIVALRDTPRVNVDPPVCLARPDATEQDCSVATASAIGPVSLVDMAAARTGDVRVVDMNDAICDEDFCRPVAGPYYVWRDTHHLTASFAGSLHGTMRERLEPEIDQVRLRAIAP